jgi:hypothetical protein
MSLNISRLSRDGLRQSVQPSREVTQQGQTIDHVPRLNRFSLGIFSIIAPARLAAASIPSEFPQITRHRDSQAPDFDAASLMLQGFANVSPETLHNTPPQPAPIAHLERRLEAGGEGVQGSPLVQSSQSIPPRRKFNQCPRP